jgi:hypothetical protein
MSEYYGVLDNGIHQQKTITGHKTKGLHSTAATQSNGALHILVWYNEKTEQDYCRIYLSPWRGVGKQAELYFGAMDEITDLESNNQQ